MVGPIGGSTSVIIGGFVVSQSLSASETSTVTLGNCPNPCATTVAGPCVAEPDKGAVSGSARAPSDGLLLAGKFAPVAPLITTSPPAAGVALATSTRAAHIGVAFAGAGFSNVSL